MGIWDVLESLMQSATSSAVEYEKKKNREINKRINEYEKKVNVADKKENLSREQKEKIKQARKKIDDARLEFNGSTQYRSSSSYASTNKLAYGGKTVAEWNSCWKSIGMLKDASLSQYNDCVGLYRHKINGKIVYVGRAIELNNGGFRKRLSDYRRNSNSGRTHSSGKTINENLDHIYTDILIVGYDEKAIETTKTLEKIFINKYSKDINLWNVQGNR